MKETVAKIELTENQYGQKKQIILASGRTLNITPKNRCFNAFTVPGEYEITTRDFNGKEAITSAKRLGNAEGVSGQPIKAMTNVAAQTLDKKLEFDKSRQKDIMIECYMGIAKDIAIANKHQEGIDVNYVMDLAAELIFAHNKILNGYVPNLDKDIKQEDNTGEVEDYNPERELL